jgi:uncharacterized protein (DUF1684 family)
MAARTPAESLQLADWRRRMANLYSEVRQVARSDPNAALEHWRRTREHLFKSHPQSPVPVEQRAEFQAKHFPADPALRFELTIDPVPPSRLGDAGGVEGTAGLTLPNSGDDELSFERIGIVTVPFSTGIAPLSVFWMSGYVGGLFLPFRDATNGNETYGAGRYVIDTAKSADLGGDPARGTIVVDFNFAYHPSCAFDPKWACPLAPPENRLETEVRAGERLA